MATAALPGILAWHLHWRHWEDMPGNAAAETFQTFYYMFTRRFLCRDDVNDVISDVEGVLKGPY